MNRKNNVRIATFLLMLSAFQANAQQTVSLKNAIQYALQNKADAIKAQLNVRNAEYQIAEAKAGALPTLTGTGALNYNPILQKNHYQVTLSVNLELLLWYHSGKMELKHRSKPSTGTFQSAGIYRIEGCQDYKRVLSD